MNAKLITALCTLGLTATLVVGQSIEDIAPANSVVVAGVKNAQRANENFERTRLYQLLQHEHIQELMERAEKELTEGPLAEIAAELNFDPEMLQKPSGSLGMAIFPVIDPEIGRPAPHMIALADYGDQADEVERFIERLLERGERDRHIEYERNRVLGRMVYSFQIVEPEPEPADDEFDFDFSFFPDPANLIGHVERMHIARNDSAFIFSSDFSALSESLERLDGGHGDRIQDRADFRGVLGQVGEENDGFAVILTRDMLQILAPLDEMGMGMMIQPMLRSTFGDIHGYGLALRFGVDDTIAHLKYSLFMPHGKGGLTSLIDTAEPREDVPAFADVDTMSYSRSTVRFDRVVGVIRQIIQSNPMLAMEVEPQFREMEPMLNEFFGTLGEEVISIGSLRRPLDVNSSQNLFAIEARDPEGFENFISQHAPQMGFEPRDFLGQRIYTNEDLFGGMMMMPGAMAQSVSIGIGGGYIFAGNTAGVEQALRMMSQPGEESGLARQEMFRRAIKNLPDGRFASWSYLNLVDQLEATFKIGELTAEQMAREMREMFPEIAEEMAEDDAGNFLEALDFDVVRRFIGPAVAEVHATDDGFVGTTILLAAEDD